MHRQSVATAILAMMAAIGFGSLASGQTDRPIAVLSQGDVIDLDGTSAKIIKVDAIPYTEGPPDDYPLAYRAEIRQSDGNVLAHLTLIPRNNAWVVAWMTRNPGDGSCAVEERWARAFARHTGFAAKSFRVSNCKNGLLHDGYAAQGIYLETNGDMAMEWVGVKPRSAQCTPGAWVGTWQRPGSPPRAKVLQLQFTKGQYGGEGIAQGYNGYPDFNGKRVIRDVYPDPQGNGCVFKAKCSSGISSPVTCHITIDPAKNTLLVQDSSFIGTYFDGPWTRSATPAPKTATCSARDIDGNWHRSDGALVPIVGIDAGFRDGGNALMFNHPDSWPKGSHKFLRLFREGGPESCKLSAVCINYDINRSTGQTFKRERNCTLTIDPQRQTLSESGSTLSYSRTPKGQTAPHSITTPAADPPVSVPVTSAQELAEIATRERLNAEQAAFAAKQIAEYEAAKAAFAKATSDREATIARQKAEHQAAVAAVEAERVRRENEHAAAMARWRADVEACKQGDVSRCAPKR